MDQVTLFDDAIQIALSCAKPPQLEMVSYHDALGRILAEDARARVSVPPFRRAMMDGFAVQSTDVNQVNRHLQIIGTTAAGNSKRLRIAQGTAVRIMTGAPLPDGADTVIRKEWCQELADGEMEMLRTVSKGESVQQEGEDGRAGDIVITAGSRLSGAEMAICRSFGISTLKVYRRPRVAIIITGSELVPDPRQKLQPGQIYGANDAFLQFALVNCGCHISNCTFVPDNIGAIRQAIRLASNQADYIITTGGVSLGDYDFTPAVLRELAGNLAVERVLMRPGSPFVIAELPTTTVFALSGNPAACFAQLHALVLPAIRKTIGQRDEPFCSSGKLTHDLHLKPIKHVRIQRATATVVDGEIRVDARLAQSSAIISSFAQANCLIRLDDSDIDAGSVVPLQWFKPLF